MVKINTDDNVFDIAEDAKGGFVVSTGYILRCTCLAVGQNTMVNAYMLGKQGSKWQQQTQNKQTFTHIQMYEICK